jgi:hypothetical protein
MCILTSVYVWTETGTVISVVISPGAVETVKVSMVDMPCCGMAKDATSNLHSDFF